LGLFSKSNLIHFLGAISYIDHKNKLVITQRIPIDAHALVACLEIVTGLAVARVKPDFHGLVIPSSSLFMLGQRSKQREDSIWAFTTHLLNPLKTFAAEIHMGAGENQSKYPNFSLTLARTPDSWKPSNSFVGSFE
jgi:hypothetical protein